MTDLITVDNQVTDLQIIKIARAIAKDLIPLEEVLKQHGMDPEQWEKVQNSPHFQRVLSSAMEEWNSTGNTAERVRLKSLYLVEEALPEMYARAHDPREPLNHKVEVLKTIARFAGLGGTSMDGAAVGEKFSVTINLGADHQLKIEKDVTPRVIEGSLTDE